MQAVALHRVEQTITGSNKPNPEISDLRKILESFKLRGKEIIGAIPEGDKIFESISRRAKEVSGAWDWIGKQIPKLPQNE